MSHRHLRRIALFGLLVILAFLGCRTARPRPVASEPQPLGQAALQKPTGAEAPTILAIDDKTPPPALPAQVAQQSTNVKPIATPGPPAVPITNGNATVTANASPMRTLHRLCAEKNATLNNYLVLMRRREVVNGTKQPEEQVLLKFRKEPWSVYFKWLGPVAKGREVVFVKDRYNNQLHILTGPNEGLLMSNKRVSLNLNDPKVMSSSRHPITEAGLGNMITRFGSLLDAFELGDPRAGKLTYLKTVQRQDYGPTPLECVHQVIPGGQEAPLPRGGQRWWFFDMNLRLPVMVVTLDDRGQEVEYYAYEQLSIRLQGFSEEEFNPANLGRLK